MRRSVSRCYPRAPNRYTIALPPPPNINTISSFLPAYHTDNFLLQLPPWYLRKQKKTKTKNETKTEQGEVPSKVPSSEYTLLIPPATCPRITCCRAANRALKQVTSTRPHSTRRVLLPPIQREYSNTNKLERSWIELTCPTSPPRQLPSPSPFEQESPDCLIFWRGGERGREGGGGSNIFVFEQDYIHK